MSDSDFENDINERPDMGYEESEDQNGNGDIINESNDDNNYSGEDYNERYSAMYNKPDVQIKESKIRKLGLTEWIQILRFEKKENISHSTILNSLRLEIPIELRPRIWAFLCEYTDYTAAHAPDIYEKLSSLPSQYDKDIEKDIPRTYGNITLFNADNQHNILDRLFRILRAYSHYDKEVGYTQGMNFIAACLLYN